MITLKIVAIIQARMESTRLPGKVLIELCGKPMLRHIVERVTQSQMTDDVIVATSVNQSDTQIEKYCSTNDIQCFRGSQNNVLERFFKCASLYKADIIVRITGDNALVDPYILDEGIKFFLGQPDIDYLYYREGLPLGMAVEIFTSAALEDVYQNASNQECLEHVTPYMYRNPHKFRALRAGCIGKDNSDLRWTMDTEQDYILISNIYKALYKDKEVFSYEDVLKEYEIHDDWRNINSGIKQIAVEYRGEKEE